jgi:hypothetical protein
MSVAALSTLEEVLAFVGLGLGAVVLVVVVLLFNRVVGPVLEIARYAKSILEAGLGIARNVDGADELLRTRELVGAVPELATDYLRKAGRVP